MKNKFLTITGALLFTLTLTACGSDDETPVGVGYQNTDVIEASEIPEISNNEDGSQEFTFDESDENGIMITIDEDGNEKMEFIEINEDDIIDE